MFLFIIFALSNIESMKKNKENLSRWLRSLIDIDLSVKILFIFSLFFIFTIGFKISCLTIDNDEINGILINLSYSIVAAIIFHFIGVHMPHYYKLEVYKTRIDRQIMNMRGAAITTYYTLVNGVSIDGDDFEKISAWLNAEYFSEPVSFMQSNDEITFYQTKVKLRKDRMTEIINFKESLELGFREILVYDDYIGKELLKKIMDVRNSVFFSVMDDFKLDDSIVLDERIYHGFLRNFISIMNRFKCM